MPTRKKSKQPTKAEAIAFMYAAKVDSRFDLFQEWSGWKLRGRYLVSPDGDRITPARLRGLLYLESIRPRVRPAKTNVVSLHPSPNAKALEQVKTNVS